MMHDKSTFVCREVGGHSHFSALPAELCFLRQVMRRKGFEITVQLALHPGWSDERTLERGEVTGSEVSVSSTKQNYACIIAMASHCLYGV